MAGASCVPNQPGQDQPSTSTSEDQCGDNAETIFTGGLQTCSCKEGYRENEDGKCAATSQASSSGDPDPATNDDDECGDHGKSVATGGFITCECDEGYHHSPGDGCVQNIPTERPIQPSSTRPATEHEEESDCGGHGQAVNVMGFMICKCDEGYALGDDFKCEPAPSSTTSEYIDQGNTYLCLLQESHDF